MGDEGDTTFPLLQLSILAPRPFGGDGQDMLVVQDLETRIHRTSAHILPINGNTLPHVHQICHELVVPEFLLGKRVQRPRVEEGIEHRALQVRGVVHHHQKRAGLGNLCKFTSVDTEKEPEEGPEQAVDHTF